jgi:hypothetical protein
MKTFPARPCGPSDPDGNQPRWLQLTAVTVLVIGLLVCTMSPASAATTAKPSHRVTFGVEPASARGADGRPYFSFGVTPGAILDDHVAVLNYSSVPLSLQLYATDAIETSSGGIGLLPATTRPTDAGSWVSLPRRYATVRVPAESAKSPGQIVVPLVVRVPDKATPGDHVGGVVASLRTVGTNASGQNVVLLVRVGTRVFIRVAGTLTSKLSLTDLHAAYRGTLNPVGQGQVTVSYVASNSGNVDLALDQSVSVSGLLGSERRFAVANVRLLLPGASLRERLVVPGVWPQFLVRATVSARPRPPAGFSAPGLVAITASTWVWAIPWPLLALVALLALAAVARRRIRSRARARSVARPLAPQPEVVSA